MQVLIATSRSNHKFIKFLLFESLTLVTKQLTAKVRHKLLKFVEHDQRFNSAMEGSAISAKIVKVGIDVPYKMVEKWQRSVERTLKESKKSHLWWNENFTIMRTKLR